MTDKIKLKTRLWYNTRDAVQAKILEKARDYINVSILYTVEHNVRVGVVDSVKSTLNLCREYRRKV